MRVDRVVAVGRSCPTSVEAAAVGDEPVAGAEDLPLGFLVTEIRASSVREHHGNTRALLHVLEIDTVHTNVPHESVMLLKASHSHMLEHESNNERSAEISRACRHPRRARWDP